MLYYDPVWWRIVAKRTVGTPSTAVFPEGRPIDVPTRKSLNFSSGDTTSTNSVPVTVTKDRSIDGLVGDEYANTGKAKDPTDRMCDATEVTTVLPSDGGGVTFFVFQCAFLPFAAT